MSDARPGRRPLAVAVGDPNGIGPEIALRAAVALQRADGVRSLLVAEDFIIDRVAAQLGLDAAARAAFDVEHVGALAPADWQPGQVSAAAGAATGGGGICVAACAAICSGVGTPPGVPCVPVPGAGAPVAVPGAAGLRLLSISLLSG